MPRRPRVEVTVQPLVVRPGAPLNATVLLVAQHRTAVERVSVTLRGTERSVHGYGKNSSAHTVTIVDDQREFPLRELSGAETLRVDFPFASSLPPSYNGSNLTIAYQLLVHVEIPWWLDRRMRRGIHVAPPLDDASPAPPRVHVNAADGRHGDYLGIEASLDRESVRPGETLSGRCAVTNLRNARVRGMVIELSAREAASSRVKMNSEEVHRFRFPLPAGAPREGETIPFAITVPNQIPSSFTGRLGKLEWTLEVVADMRWAPNVSLPIPIDIRPRLSGGAAPRPALVGSARRARLWQLVGSQLGLDSDENGDYLTLVHGGCTLTIGHEERGDGNFLVAQVRWPPLGLALSVGKHRLFDGRHLKVGHPPFDRRYRVSAREEAQARAIFSPSLCAALLHFPEVTIDDSGARFATTGQGHLEEPLHHFVVDARAAFLALIDALDRIPPPAALLPYLAAWRSFGKRIEARFDASAVRLREGKLLNQRVDLGVLWSGDDSPEVEGTLLKVALDPPLAAPIDPGAASLSSAERDLITRLRAIDPHASLGPTALQLTVPWASIDPAALDPILSTMATLAGALHAGSHEGPYR